MVTRGDAENYKMGVWGARVCSSEQSSSSASVLHVGLAEDLHIWVMLVVFLSSWASHPIKEPSLCTIHHQTGSLKSKKWPSGLQTAASPTLYSVSPDLRNYGLFSCHSPKPCPEELMW